MRTPPLYKFLDLSSGILLIALTLFLGWGFGINGLPWALWTVRTMGWALGGLLIGKWILCRVTGYHPLRHGTAGIAWPIRALMILTGLILAWVLVSWLNPRADASFGLTGTFRGFSVLHYRDDFIPWLPHTYDLTATRSGFWTYTALAAAFWAARDWFRGNSRRERYQEGTTATDRLPDRILQWLWIWILSALVMGVTGVLQRLDGTEKLLWIIPWGKYSIPSMQFGPYMYRANAAQYFNLIWPVALGFWWTLRQQALAANSFTRLGNDASVVLLPITGVLAACPAITLTRVGTILTGVMLLTSGITFLGGRRGIRKGAAWSLAAVFAGAFALVLWVAGDKLAARFNSNDFDSLNGRTKLFTAAEKMIRDFSWLGSGAETVPAVYSLYRTTSDENEALQGYIHNDYLETVATFGWIGAGFIFAAVLLVPVIWRWGGGTPVSGVFSSHIAIAFVGLLFHATVDFPFQITALLGTALILTALLTSLGPPRGNRSP